MSHLFTDDYGTRGYNQVRLHRVGVWTEGKKDEGTVHEWIIVQPCSSVGSTYAVAYEGNSTGADMRASAGYRAPVEPNWPKEGGVMLKFRTNTAYMKMAVWATFC